MRIFIAGPWGDYSGVYSVIKQIMNVSAASAAGADLIKLGHEVYVPHTIGQYWTTLIDRDQAKRQTDSFLDNWAEALFRLPGKSDGADDEVLTAMTIGLDVFALGITIPHRSYTWEEVEERTPIWDLLTSIHETQQES